MMSMYCINWKTRKFYAYFKNRLYAIPFDKLTPHNKRILIQSVVSNPHCYRVPTQDPQRWMYKRTAKAPALERVA